MRVAVRLPNHLGDTIMGWPALQALDRRHDVTLYGPQVLRPFWEGPWRSPQALSPADHDVALLFATSFRAAWEARRIPRRVGVPTDARRWLLTDVVAPRTHRSDTYAALALTVGAVAVGPPRLRPRVRRPRTHVGLNPIVRGGNNRAWPHFAALADALDRPVRFYAGPGEEAWCAEVAGVHPRRVGLSLPALAETLEACGAFVSNDAGAAHFAAAVGVPVVVVYGPTSRERTGPAGARGLPGTRLPCAPCYRNRCHVPPQRCFAASVAEVIGEVEAAWDT